MSEKFKNEFSPEKAGKKEASIKIEHFFEKGGDAKTTIKGAGSRQLTIEKIDDQTLKITERGKTGDKFFEQVEYVLPISMVEQIIPEQKGDPGVVIVKDGWAYPWGNLEEKQDLNSYKKLVRDILDTPPRFNKFHIGLPEAIKTSCVDIESGSLYSFGEKDMIFRTEEEAIRQAKIIAERAKELDTPSIDSIYGKITPRELSLFRKLDELDSQIIEDWEWDYDSSDSLILGLEPVEDGNGNYKWVSSVKSLKPEQIKKNIESLKQSIKDAPNYYAKYNDSEYKASLIKEAERIHNLVVHYILERVEK